MTAHRYLGDYLRIAFGCMACDGEIADAEVACLRSIAVQLGQTVDAVDPALAAVGAEFSKDAAGTVRSATTELNNAGLGAEDAALLLEMLVQMAEADGTVHANERKFIQETIGELGLDRTALRKDHPEWAIYLAPTLTIGERDLRWLAEAVPEIPDLSRTIEPRSEEP